MARKKILIVGEDNTILALLLLQLSDDYEVAVTGRTDEEGLKQVIGLEKPDLIILDVVMPQIEGVVVGLLIRKISPVPMIMLSIFEAYEGRKQEIDFESCNLLIKPYNMDKLKQEIGKALQPDFSAELSL